MKSLALLAQFTPDDPQTRQLLLIALAAFIVLFPILVGLFLVRTWARQKHGKRKGTSPQSDQSAP